MGKQKTIHTAKTIQNSNDLKTTQRKYTNTNLQKKYITRTFGEIDMMASHYTIFKQYTNKQQIIDLVNSYLSLCKGELLPITKVGFCCFCGITPQAYQNIEKGKDEFLKETLSYIDLLSTNNLINGSLLGKYNATFSMFLLRNHHNFIESNSNNTIVIDNVNGLIEEYEEKLRLKSLQ